MRDLNDLKNVVSVEAGMDAEVRDGLTEAEGDNGGSNISDNVRILEILFSSKSVNELKKESVHLQSDISLEGFVGMFLN